MRLENVCFFYEGDFYKIKENEKVLQLLKNYKYGRSLFKEENGLFSFAITGIMILDDMPVVIFPKNYCVSEDLEQMKAEAALLLRTLIRYRRENCTEWEQTQSTIGKSLIDSSSGITEALYILDDYQKYGILKRKRRIHSQIKMGRIDWVHTIQKTQSLLSHRRPVFMDPVMVSNVGTQDDMIQRIHAYLIGKIRYLWGWLYNDFPSSTIIPVMPCSKDIAIEVLLADLRQNFVQREINLIHSMLRYLRAKRGQQVDEQNQLMITPDFNLIWEKVCGTVLGNVYDQVRTTLIPETIFNGVETHNIKRQIPDILCIRNNNLYVFDAKYYNHHKTFPGWPDMAKQFFYWYTISNHIKVHKRHENPVVNAFLLPASENEKCVAESFLGEVKVEDNPSLGSIQVWLLNTKKMLLAYTGKEDSKYMRDTFFKAIDQKIGKI